MGGWSFHELRVIGLILEWCCQQNFLHIQDSNLKPLIKVKQSQQLKFGVYHIFNVNPILFWQLNRQTHANTFFVFKFVI